MTTLRSRRLLCALAILSATLTIGCGPHLLSGQGSDVDRKVDAGTARMDSRVDAFVRIDGKGDSRNAPPDAVVFDTLAPVDAPIDAMVMAPPDSRLPDAPPPCAPGTLRCGRSCVNAVTDPANCGGCGVVCTGGLVCLAGTCTPNCAPLALCSGACVDPQSDPANCGGCGRTCASGTCQSGVCCGAGLTNCKGVCTSLATDPANCGACGVGCASGQTCQSGICCLSAQIACGGACVDPATDPSNCGGCGTVCPTGMLCSGGRCSPACGASYTYCPASSTCANLSTDPANCGACGAACPTGQSCLSGRCCPTGDLSCNGACVDPSTDPTNCGACGTGCGSSAYCASGHCLPDCSAPMTLCGSTCTSLSTDPSNCGACGTACPAGATCQARLCCGSGLTNCGGTCTSLASDAANCGGCGIACSGGEICTRGTCTCPSGAVLCSGSCSNLATDSANCGACGVSCGSGTACANGACCPTGEIGCGGVCVDPNSDSANCGGCGISCPTGTRCSSGACACGTNETLCSGTCTDTVVDPNNCGACGHACSPSQTCESSGCTGKCTAPLAACGGTCVDTSSDSANCGGCGKVCAAGTGCNAGHCVAAVSLGAPPAKCTAGGPLIFLSNGTTGASGAAGTCAGDVAATSFPWALCACSNIGIPKLGGNELYDAYDSAAGPYTPGGLGGSVGADGPYNGGGSTDVSGDVWSGNAGGLAIGNASIAQRLHVLGQLGGGATVGGNGYVSGPFAGKGSFGGTLYTPSCAAVTGQYSDSACVSTPVSFPSPCDCSASDEVPIEAYVAYYASPAHNDDAAIGLSPSTYDAPGAPARLDLPCGDYYLDRLVISNTTGLTIVAHGNTALFIGGSVDIKGPLAISLDPTANFDVFIGGVVYDAGHLAVGTPSYPNQIRFYVGGVCGGGGASCATNGDCCSDSCSAGTCAAGSAIQNATPWSVALQNPASIAGEVYAPNGELFSGTGLVVYGSLFTGSFQCKATTTIHYDKAVASAGASCPPPVTACTSCLDCTNQACIGGTCGACTDDSQCCAPLRCVSGTCTFGIGL